MWLLVPGAAGGYPWHSTKQVSQRSWRWSDWAEKIWECYVMNVILLYMPPKLESIVNKAGIWAKCGDFNPFILEPVKWTMTYLRHSLSAFLRKKRSEFDVYGLQCNMPPPLGKIKRVGAEVESRTAAGLVMKLRMLHGESGFVSNSQRHLVTSPGDGSVGQWIRWLCLCRTFLKAPDDLLEWYDNLQDSYVSWDDSCESLETPADAPSNRTLGQTGSFGRCK
jgi:hypothetical protein